MSLTVLLVPQSGSGYDLAAYESASLAIAQHAEHSVIVVEKSTVPVRTAERIRELFEANRRRPDIHFEVLSNPEFLAEV
jgi:UDPglucose 6-dehydrogenase